MTPETARLSRARTFLLWALAFVWFSEMLLSGVRPLTESWTKVWEYSAPGDPRLYLTYAVLAAGKGALAVLAVFAIRTRSPTVRTALFIPMALVPPLNVVFPFRAQGFLLRPTLIGTTLTVILWQTFFLFRDGRVHQGPASRPARLTPHDVIRYTWFGANALALSVAATMFAFAPAAGVRLAFPCFSGPGDVLPSGVTLTGMVVGTHLTAVATATWIATFYSRSNASVRRAVTASITTLAAILCVVPLRQLALEGGTHCAATSLLIYAIPLLGGWLAYAALSYRRRQADNSLLAATAGH